MILHDDGAAGPGAGLRLVLGSASPGRAEVLTRARVPSRADSPGVAAEAAASPPD
ncbi:septum formation inhibitor Maf, partial [Micrococcus sp. HSID17245]